MTFLPSSEQSLLEQLAGRVNALEREVRRLEALEQPFGLVPLDLVELDADTASVTFSGISGIYAALKLVVFARTDRAATGDSIDITFNNDVGNNYNFLTSRITHSGALATTEGLPTPEISIRIVGDSAPANAFAEHEIIIPDYAGANHKILTGRGTRKLTDLTGGTSLLAESGYWQDTSAITEIDMVPRTGTNFKAGSKFYLYGLTTPN
jgi:hypothetical protein